MYLRGCHHIPRHTFFPGCVNECSPPSKWHSSQTLWRCHRSWSRGRQCCSDLKWVPAALIHSSSPSRLFRPCLWLSERRIYRWIDTQFGMQWIVRTLSFPAPLVSSVSLQCCQDSCWGSLATRLHHLRQGVFKDKVKERNSSYCICTLPRGGMFWEIHPPRPKRIP